MATASVTYTTAAGYTGTGTLTYSVSSTNTATTFSATKFIVTSDYKTNYICRAVMDGDVFVNILHDGGGAISYTKSWNKSTSAQTKNLDLQWYETVNGQTRILKTTTVQISIPALASYSVTYNANGGTGTTASQTKYYGQNLTLRANGFTRTNYAFKCWNTNTSDPAASRYAASATYTGNAALALYAIWNPIISYNANGGSGAPSNQTKTFNTALTLSSTQPTRTGYTFSKWNTAANGTGTDYNPGGTVAASMNTATTMYAQWTANTYTISFNANGGVGAPASISKTYGQSVTLPTDKPTRIGHTFMGWASSSSAETAQWLAGANFSEAITADTTLYAVWRDDYQSPSITTLRAYRCGFELTTDVAIDPDKTYYERSGSGTSEDPYIYTEVEEPDVSDLPTYYELIDDDEAGYARIEATWSIDTSVDEGVVNSATMTGTITPEGQQAQAITFQSGYQGTSGNAVALVEGLDVDTQYTVTVTVTDVRGASAATSRTVLLLRAFYIFDFGSQGNAVGIGRAAPQSGMEVGYPATFDDAVNLYDELQFNGEQAYPTFIRESWSESSDQTTLPVLPCFVMSTLDSSLYWCDSNSIRKVNHAPMTWETVGGMTWAQVSAYTWGRLRGQTRELPPTGGTMDGLEARRLYVDGDVSIGGDVKDANGANKYQPIGDYAGIYTGNGMQSGVFAINSANIPYLRWTKSDGTINQLLLYGDGINHQKYENGAWSNVGVYLNSNRTVLAADTGSVSIPGTSTYTQAATLDIPGAGIYELNYGGAFAANATGYRGIYLSVMGSGRYSPTAAAAPASEQTRFGASQIYSFTAATTVTLYARQSSGTALTFYPYIRAVRIA